MGDEKPREGAQDRHAGDAREHRDDDAVVERLHQELEAARERVAEAWRRYRQSARTAGLQAIAGSPLLPALIALVQQQS